VRELLREHLRVLIAREVAALATPAGDRVDDAADELADARLALRRAEGPTEVLLRDDVGGVLRPRDRELDGPLLERVAALLEVGDDGVTLLPLDLVERVDAVAREVALEGQPFPDHPDVSLSGGHRHLLVDRSSASLSTGGEGTVENYRRVILHPAVGAVKLPSRISCGRAS
jgi:hypothetical protein